MIVAIPLAAVLIIAAIWATWFLAEHEYSGRHAFADPADVADPDGERYVAELHREPRQWEPPLDGPGLDRLLRALKAWQRPALIGDPADTAPIPHAMGTWGKTVTQLVDEMEAAYLDVKR
jgi:hypothetical protein